MVLGYAHALTRSQAGLFSAVASAFIIEVHSHLLPDPNDETAALLRVLIHKIDNTTFGNDPPTLPQWTGPPHTIVRVQAILFASLFVSLFSAFLAMLGKQWLYQYTWTDRRGSVIERSQNRQRKLDGVVAWYFDHVVESLPLVLQIGPFLLGCALSLYLWGIDITVASVVLGISSLGATFYLLIVVAGMASESCPYQTPGARNMRYIFLPALRSAPSLISKFSVLAFTRFSDLIQASRCRSVFSSWKYRLKWSWHSALSILPRLMWVPVLLPIALVTDLCNLGLAMGRLLVASGRTAYHRFIDTSYTHTDVLGQQSTTLDLRCVSWMLRTSSDKVVHLSTLEHLATMTMLANSDPTIVVDCFNVFVSCFKVNDHKVVVMKGMERLAAVSTLCFFNTVSHFYVLDPTLGILEDVRRRYTKIFPTQAHFHVHQFSHILNAIHDLFTQPQWASQSFQWATYEPSTYERIAVAHNLTKVALLGYQGMQRAKVPRWILRFAFHSLSLDPLPPTSVVADCLSIIAIDLGCDISNTRTIESDER